MTFYSPSSFEPGFRLRDGAAANLEEGNPKVTTEDQITATGTTVLDARPLRATVNSILTTTPGSGVLLPKAIPGVRVYVFNRGASNLLVYGQPGETLDAGVASVTLTALARCSYTCATPGQWLSALLGATSA
jgi:hypothetical protein